MDQALQLSDDELEKRTKSDSGYTFLHAIAGHARSRSFLRDQLVAVLLAGRDTTACTLAWLFYHLSVQPQVVQKLRKEIEDVVGLDRAPTYENLKAMRYLQVSSLSRRQKSKSQLSRSCEPSSSIKPMLNPTLTSHSTA